MKDRRKDDKPAQIPDKLRKKGMSQLEAEISILESWLADLDETREDNPASIIARESYTEMLQNRRELLESLTET